MNTGNLMILTRQDTVCRWQNPFSTQWTFGFCSIWLCCIMRANLAFSPTTCQLPSTLFFLKQSFVTYYLNYSKLLICFNPTTTRYGTTTHNKTGMRCVIHCGLRKILDAVHAYGRNCEHYEVGYVPVVQFKPTLIAIRIGGYTQ